MSLENTRKREDFGVFRGYRSGTLVENGLIEKILKENFKNVYLSKMLIFVSSFSSRAFFPQIFNVKQKENQTSFIIIYANQKNSHEAFKIY